MAQTIIGLNDAKAVKKWSKALAVDVGTESYFTRKYMGMGESARTPIQMLPHLESDAGEYISFDLSMQLGMQPVEGDDVLEGKEEDLKFYTDGLYINQLRGGVNTGGKMTRKRTLHDLRKVARSRQGEWWARVFDELFWMYLSGARGANTEFIFPLSYAGFATNSFGSPDTEHIMYGGSATSKASVTAADKMDLNMVDRLKARATMMGGGTQGTPQIQPIRINGADHYLFVINPWQEYDMRVDTSTGQWLDIQKALATSEGRSSPLVKGGCGMHNDVVIQSHKGAIRYTDYGAGSDVAACRALFMGVQAGVIAFGSAGSGLRFDWHEEERDNGNQAVITTSTICGIKKTTYTIDGTAKDFGVIAADTAAADPG